MKTFDDWLYDTDINDNSRADRLSSLINSNQFRVIEKWLEAAYNQGREDERDTMPERRVYIGVLTIAMSRTDGCPTLLGKVVLV